MVCLRPGCGALVDLWRAKREASARAQASYALDDGCGASSRRKPGCFSVRRWKKGQAKMATALLDGTRRLITWPSGTAQSCVEDVLALVKRDEEAHAAARVALAKF